MVEFLKYLGVVMFWKKNLLATFRYFLPVSVETEESLTVLSFSKQNSGNMSLFICVWERGEGEDTYLKIKYMWITLWYIYKSLQSLFPRVTIKKELKCFLNILKYVELVSAMLTSPAACKCESSSTNCIWYLASGWCITWSYDNQLQ